MTTRSSNSHTPDSRTTDSRAQAACRDLTPRVRVSGKFLWKGEEKFFLKGVTYGPFAPDAAGDYFASPARTRGDFHRIASDLGANTIRTYYAPPAWLVAEAEAAGLHVLVDVPWPKHLCFLDAATDREAARRAVRSAVRGGRGSRSVLAYSIGNEVPAGVVRWHGARRVERFLAELADVARQEDPEALLTYANYPSTEFLDAPFLDFATFNVYLQDEATFRRYVQRLQNQVGDRPLILGEFGLDTLRNGEDSQAEMLAWHVRAVREAGIAGTTVYAWTDDWFTGGHQIEDWAFGITRRDRSPKAAYPAVREAFALTSGDLLGPDAPRVSVVVCSYNGGATLAQCLASLGRVDYPDYEVILVDDGSTDDTRAIAARFPEVKTIHQDNHGLSHARNVGLSHATGEVVAYTDSDCFADPDWLTYLVLKLRETGAAGVGGPNLTPDDGALASCVAASPGQPAHVLLSDSIAEHVPGCNMAFWKASLERINGFDPDYRAAGDDVDLCWRLQHEGHQIAFAPGATVWHHRRQNVRTFLKQQRGYGHAEGLLKFKHPDKFNERGDSRWHGSMYGLSAWGLRLGGPIIYHGVFGAGLFQTLYTPQPAHWLMLAGSLEWILTAVVLMLLGPVRGVFGFVGLAMVEITVALALAQAIQARIPKRYDGFRARLVVAYLCLAQPLVRSTSRYLCHLRVTSGAAQPQTGAPPAVAGGRMVATRCETAYWGEGWQERTALLGRFVRGLDEHGFPRALDSGWTDWDVEAFVGAWARVRARTVEEDHGGGHRLVRVRWQLLPTVFTRAWLLLLLLAATLLATRDMGPAEALAGGVLGVFGFAWFRSARRSRAIVGLMEQAAADLGYWPRPWRPKRASRAARRGASGAGAVSASQAPTGTGS